MRKAYSYIRLSTETQLKGDGLRRQLEKSKNYALQHSLELVNSIDGVELKDIGVSAFKSANTQKGTLSIFLRLLEDGKIEKDSILLIESLDRLSRDKITSALTQFMSILDSGIEIVTLIDGQTYTKEKLNREPSSLYISLGVMFRANDESETKSNRLSSAWKNKRDNAATKVLTKTLPAWLSYNDESQTIEIVADKAKIVKKIFEMCIDTCGLYIIAKHLNESKVPVFSTGKLWYRSYITKILHNRAVLGEFQPHKIVNKKRVPEGDVIPNYFPRVIDEQMFHLAHAAIHRRTLSDKGRKGKTFGNLFSGIVYCGTCGSKMSFRNRGSEVKGGKSLLCSKKMEGGSCSSSEWGVIAFESRIISHLREVEFSSLINKEVSKQQQIQDELTSLKSQLKEKNIEVEKFLDMVQTEDLNESVKNKLKVRLNAHEDAITEITQQIKAKELELESELEIAKLFDAAELKNMLRLIDEKQSDYLFRSSVNQLLAKTIERIELCDMPYVFQPWDFDDEDGIVKQFRKLNLNMSKHKIDQLVEKESFKRFASKYHNQILIRYRTGTVRRIFVGDDMSIVNSARRK